jgi:hypothetical protein
VLFYELPPYFPFHYLIIPYLSMMMIPSKSTLNDESNSLKRGERARGGGNDYDPALFFLPPPFDNIS